MMATIAPETLMSLETYARERPQWRARVISHRKRRSVRLGEHVTLQFEDELTVRYQVQEMLRVERIFEPRGIQDEIDVYGPLVPDGSNWKATMMIEYPDVAERRNALARLIGIEDRVWVKVGDGAKVYAIADEDLDRETDEKTSAVHFLRFELTPADCAAARGGAPLFMGIDHPAYRAEIQVAEVTRSALLEDLR